MTLETVFRAQREFFSTGATLPYEFRRNQLRTLANVLDKYEAKVLAALKDDLGKSSVESFVSEYAFVKKELNHTLKHLKKWMKPVRVPTPLLLFPSRSYYQHEPHGVTVVFGAFNYPFQLTLSPLIGALAAGNTVIIKPSELTPRAEQVMTEIINQHFPSELVYSVTGGPEVGEALSELPFNFIFFTGSTRVGRIIAKNAADKLIPYCLELGGKSPAIVDSTADLALAARKIAWGKFYNSGQSCVAPDYALVHESVKDAFVQQTKMEMTRAFGADASQSPDYGRLVNERHFSRLTDLIARSTVITGGRTNASQKYIEPTVIEAKSFSDPIMQDEIFGPLLPIMTYKNLDEAIAMVQSQEPPLSLYFFTKDKDAEAKILTRIRFGGGCVNDCMVHLFNSDLPFGGVGPSGMGAYHGKFSFDTFSHRKGIVKAPSSFDLPLRYPPYKSWTLRLFRWLLR